MPVGVYTGNVGGVVTVLFQEPNHGVFAGKVGIPAVNIPSGDNGAVVTDLESPPNGGALVKVRTTIGVVGLPSGIGGLKNHLCVAGVVADNEGDVA